MNFPLAKISLLKGSLLADVIVRHLPAKPIFFGIFAFGILALFLYLVLRMDRE
jgi:hypothetical protein